MMLPKQNWREKKKVKKDVEDRKEMRDRWKDRRQ